MIVFISVHRKTTFLSLSPSPIFLSKRTLIQHPVSLLFLTWCFKKIRVMAAGSNQHFIHLHVIKLSSQSPLTNDIIYFNDQRITQHLTPPFFFPLVPRVRSWKNGSSFRGARFIKYRHWTNLISLFLSAELFPISNRGGRFRKLIF